jgi:hypothetical protein
MSLYRPNDFIKIVDTLIEAYEHGKRDLKAGLCFEFTVYGYSYDKASMVITSYPEAEYIGNPEHPLYHGPKHPDDDCSRPEAYTKLGPCGEFTPERYGFLLNLRDDYHAGKLDHFWMVS